MHILIIPSWYPKNPSDVSGVFFRDQALALSDAGHEVGVVAPTMKSLRKIFNRAPAAVPYFESDNGVPTYRKSFAAALPRVPYGNYLLFKMVVRSLLKDYINNHGVPDVIHTHAAIFAGAAVVELAREKNMPVVHTEHSSGFATRAYAAWQMKLAERAYLGCKTCIAVSPALAQILEAQMPSTKGQWIWLPNMVSDRFSRSGHGLIYERNTLAPIFLSLALMKKGKGHLDLLNAFRLLVSDGFPAVLWLAGDGPLRNALEAEAYRLGIADRVYFLGLIPPGQVPELLAQVDVMVVPSHNETFGVVVAEALMSGLPVVATRCGGPECIVQKGDGLLAQTRNPRSLAAAMRQVGENLESYDGRAIAQRARGRFSGPALAAILTDLYERVVEL